MGSSLTIEHVAQIMPNARANGLEEEFEYLLETAKRYEITTKNRFACWIANVAKESGELMYVEELADGWDYEWREDLGNIYEGDGPKYKGHGYIQITGRNNHYIVGQALGIDATGNPEILTQMPYAWYSAGYYWRYMSAWGDLNAFADEGDFAHTVLGVRGGEDPDRWHYYYTAMDVLPDDLEIGQETGDTIVESAQRNIGFDKDGWVLDLETNLYVRSERKSDTLYTNANGWLWGKLAATPQVTKQWEWPEASDDPISDSSSYQDRHPTRYAWRPDIEKWARYLVDNYDVWCNTYYEHPEGYGFNVASTDADGTTWYVQNTSIDVWGPGGRNDPIDYNVGQEIFQLLFNDPNPPNINWIIWQRQIFGAWNGWNGESFGDGTAFTNHEDHVHCTFV